VPGGGGRERGGRGMFNLLLRMDTDDVSPLPDIGILNMHVTW
jgi:hypothetical protein